MRPHNNVKMYVTGIAMNFSYTMHLAHSDFSSLFHTDPSGDYYSEVQLLHL